MSEVITLPVIPLREAVLFPEVTSPIAAGRAGTLRAIEAALRNENKQIFVVSQRENREDVTSDILYSMGCVATIGPVQRGPSGMRLLLNGNYRAVAIRYDEQDEYMVASLHEAEEMLPLDPDDPTFAALYRETRERAAEPEPDLDLVEHERGLVEARQQAQRPEEPLGREPVATLALHRLDDRAEVRAGAERLVHRDQRRDLGREQRVVLGLAEPLAELADVAGRGGGVEPARRGGLVGRRVPHRERRERALVAVDLERRALRRGVGRVQRQQRAAVEAALEREHAGRVLARAVDPAQRHRLLVRLGPRRHERDVGQPRDELAQRRRVVGGRPGLADRGVVVLDERLAELDADPIGPNARLGTYTNFVNLLDLAALAVPGPRRPDGLPAGITLIGPRGTDAALAALGMAFAARCAASRETQAA